MSLTLSQRKCMFSLRSITLDGTDACTAVRSGKALSTLLTPGIKLRPKSSTRYSLVFSSLECPAVDATTTGTGVPLGEVPSTLLTSRYPDYVLPGLRTKNTKTKNINAKGSAAWAVALQLVDLQWLARRLKIGGPQNGSCFPHVAVYRGSPPHRLGHRSTRVSAHGMCPTSVSPWQKQPQSAVMRLYSLGDVWVLVVTPTSSIYTAT